MRNLVVVPANAGTHNHSRSFLGKVLTPAAHIEKARRMGPGFRRDGEWTGWREASA